MLGKIWNRATVALTLYLCVGLILPTGSPIAFAANKSLLKAAPISTDKTLLRMGPGAFGAQRSEGKTHTGVDIVANQTSPDKKIYQVNAVSDGTVAYAMFNGEKAEEGYGYTVVIDHGNGIYTLYAHLATLASAGVVTVGMNVAKGQLLGYLADPEHKELSSGNVLADVVKPYDKIQLHFEEFKAPSGRTSQGSLANIKSGSDLVDPTAELVALGYKTF